MNTRDIICGFTDQEMRAELLRRSKVRIVHDRSGSLNEELAPTPEAYQVEAMRNVDQQYGSARSMANLSLAGLGIAGEAGEVVDLIKKHLHHEAPLDINEIKKECGDVLWYITLLCEILGITLEDVMGANIVKLRKRFPGEWSAEAQRAKADEAAK